MDELRKQLLDSIDESSIPDLSYSIKAIYKDRVNKQIPWWKSKLIWGIALPSLTAATVLAIVLPLTVFKNQKQNSIIPIINKQLQTTETAYSVSTLSLANAISINAGTLTEVSQSIQQEYSGENYGNGWNDWNGWDKMGGQDALKEVLSYGTQYMYVVERMLNNNLNQLPDDFQHVGTKDGYEEYNCVFDKDKEFECSFHFFEKPNEDKTLVGVKGELGVKNNTFEVEGKRDNVSDDKPAKVVLNVKFDNNDKYKYWWEQKNPVLKFEERQDSDGNLVYSFTYSEQYQDRYVVDLTYSTYDVYLDPSDLTKVDVIPWVKMNVTKYNSTYTPYYPGGGGYYMQPQTFTFDIEKGNDGNLVIYLLNFGAKLFIDVRDENGYYYYYLKDFNENDPFDGHKKH